MAPPSSQGPEKTALAWVGLASVIGGQRAELSI